MKAGNVKLVFLVITVSLILGTSQLPMIALAAPAQNEKFGTPLAIPLVPITDDDLFSTTDLTTLLDPTGTSTQHYGPYASSSPDSGTCGNDWATDTFNRHFTVFMNPDGTPKLVVEQFKDGSFLTPAIDSPPTNFSPGGCESSVTPQGTVSNGVTGSLHGYFLIPIPPGVMQTSTSPYCDAVGKTNANCDTTTFIDTHFTPCYGAGVCSVTTFFFHYTAAGQSLIDNEWKNASTDRGGNQGDIRSNNI